MHDGSQTEPRTERHSEPRLVTEKGLEARIASIVEPVIEDLGFDLVRIRVTGQNGCTVQIMAEQPDGIMTIEGCEAISRALSPVLDVEDPVDREYHLEISSPGIDRPLVRKRDFVAWSGHVAKIELNIPVNGRRRFRGLLDGVDEGELKMRLPDVPADQPSDIRLPLSELSEAKLIMTDELMELALKAQPDNNAGGETDLAPDQDE